MFIILHFLFLGARNEVILGTEIRINMQSQTFLKFEAYIENLYLSEA